MTYCGTTNGYTAPTAAQAGSVRIGSRTYAVAPGVLPPQQLTRAGGNVCVIGDLDQLGRFAAFRSVLPFGTVGATGVTYGACGTVAEYRAPTATDPGLLRFADDGRETIVPSSVALPAGSTSGYRCFTASLSAVGDAIITGVAAIIGSGGTPVTSTSGETYPGDASGARLVLALAAFVAATLLMGRGRVMWRRRGST